MSEKYKKTRKYIIYAEHLLILASAVTGRCLISAFASSVAIPVVDISSSVRTKICTIFAWIKKYKPIIKTTRKKHDKNVLLGNDTLNTIEVLIFKALIKVIY